MPVSLGWKGDKGGLGGGEKRVDLLDLELNIMIF